MEWVTYSIAFGLFHYCWGYFQFSISWLLVLYLLYFQYIHPKYKISVSVATSRQLAQTTFTSSSSSSTSSLSSSSFVSKTNLKSVHQLQLINSMVQFFWPKYSWIENRVLEFCNTQARELLLNNPYIEDIQIHYIRIGTHPIQFHHCSVQQIHANQFVINLDFFYKHFEMQYTVKPKIIPLHLNFLLKEFEIQGTCKFILEFDVSQKLFWIHFSLQDYPTMHWNLQLFQNLQIDTQKNNFFLDYLKKKIQSIVMDYLVFPKYVPIFSLQIATNETTTPMFTNGIPWHQISELLQQSDAPLEEEVKTILQQIQSLLTLHTVQTNTEIETDTTMIIQKDEQIRKELLHYLILFLKKSLEPNKLPLSMMQSVKIAIQIVNYLIFVNGEVADRDLLMILLEPYNWETIGQIARVSQDADELINNVMQIGNDEQVRNKVNQTCRELSMQDVPFIVKSRFRNK